MNHLLRHSSQKKSHPNEATLVIQTAREVISEPLKVELAFDAPAKKKMVTKKQEMLNKKWVLNQK